MATSTEHSADRPGQSHLVDRRPMCAAPGCLSRVEPPNTPGAPSPYCPCHNEGDE